MADVVPYTSLMITTIIATLVFIPTVFCQNQCKNVTLWANGYLHNNDITSPNYPSLYPSLVDCQWKILTFPQEVIVLELLDFNLEGSQPNCSYDYVEIYDGYRTISSRIKLLCGQVANMKLTSTGTVMTVVFHSDGSNNFKGFRFLYLSYKESADCKNGTLIASEARFNGAGSSYITSPNYPENYPSLMDCQWKITNFHSMKIVLEFLDFNLEGSQPNCIHDYVAIYDGYNTSFPRIQLLCGQVADTKFTSTGSYMTVVFHSDGSNNFKGFKFRYSSYSSYKEPVQLQQSNGFLIAKQHEKYFTTTSYFNMYPRNIKTLVATEDVMYFTSPNYPNKYPSNIDFEWQIYVSSFSHMIVLKLLDFYVDNFSMSCGSDYVAIFNGSRPHSQRIQLLCGQVSNRQFTGSNMIVVFHSNGRNNFKGFKFEYTSMEKKRKTIRTTDSKNANTTIAICTCVMALGIFGVCVLVRATKRHEERIIQNMTLGLNAGREATVRRERSPFITTPPITYNDPNPSPHVGMEDSENASEPSQYANLNLDDSLPGDSSSESSLFAMTPAITYNEPNPSPHVGIEDSENTTGSPPYASRNLNMDDNLPADTSSESSLFAMTPTITYNPSPHVGIEDSENTTGPPPYASLNLNMDDNLPADTSRGPGLNIDDLPPPYSEDLPGGPAHQEQLALLYDSRPGRSRDGVGSTSGDRTNLNRGLNFTNRDEVVIDYMTGQILYVDINPT